MSSWSTKPANGSWFRQILAVVSWIPPHCRWNPSSPPPFTWSLNFLYASTAAFTVANLYYNHPILNLLAQEFHVTYEEASRIPALMQAGYTVGLFFLCPLGDLLPRRPFILLLVGLTASLWIVLCLTSSYPVFQAFSFIVSVTTVTPQLTLPLVGDLVPANRRAAALSIVTSGFALGILTARVLSGTVANFTSWRNIYWLSCALQYTIFFLLWLFMPDYPSKNPQGLNYFKLLFSILTIFFQEPLLIQACLNAFFSAATFTGFWTTVTFLLVEDPYNYSPLVVGLFGLIGIAGMLLNPLYARIVTDNFVPLFSVIIGNSVSLLGIIVGTYTGTFTVAGPVIQALFNDFGIQTAQIANRVAIYAIHPTARNRINVAFMLCVFCGQLMGTSAVNHVYAKGGWIVSGSTCVAFICSGLLIAFLRSPRETGWIGWRGGWNMRKTIAETPEALAANAIFYQPQAERSSEGQEKMFPSTRDTDYAK